MAYQLMPHDDTERLALRVVNVTVDEEPPDVMAPPVIAREYVRETSRSHFHLIR
jgi:hypothetical protein